MNKKETFFISVISLLLLFLYGCGRDAVSNNHTSDNTGSAVFSVEWQGNMAKQSPASDVSHPVSTLAKAVDCAAAGVETIEASVYDSSNKRITSTSGGPWKCSDHSGEISDIPVGTGYWIDISFKNISGSTLYTGKSNGFSIEGGKATEVGVIKVSLSAPSGVTAAAGDGQATINWGTVSGATGYYVYWSESSGVSTTIYKGRSYVTSNSANLTGLTNETTYHFIVTAVNVNTDTESSPSTEVSATPKGKVNSVPSNTTGANFINSGASSTYSATVTLTLSATDDTGVVAYYASESSAAPSADTAGWVSVTSQTSYSGGVTFTLSSGAGTKNVYVWFKDAAGGVSAVQIDSITLAILDSAAPASPAISINSGATSTLSASVTLTLSATDDTGVTGYCAREALTTPETPEFTAACWQSVTSATNYSANIAATLSDNYSTKTVYVWFRDAAGNVSAVVSDSITLSAPVLTLIGGSLQGNPLSLTSANAHVTTIAGSAGLTGSTNGTGSAARFNAPFGVTTDGTNLFVSDYYNHTIRKVVISTGVVTTIAGSAGITGSTNGTGSAARFNAPEGITTDGTNLFVSDGNNHTIRKVVISTGVVTTIAGSAGLTGSTNGTGSAARFNNPRGITTDGTNLFVSDYYNHTIRKVVISTGVVTTIAGSAGLTGSTNGTGSAARFNAPFGITTDGTNLFVSDTNNHTIRKVVISTGVVTTIAGSAGLSGSTDGTGSAARIYYPSDITTDGTNLFVSDAYNNTIRKVVISTGVVTTIAGSAGLYGSTNGIGSAARFNWPFGITTDGINLFVSDFLNVTIRKISP